MGVLDDAIREHLDLKRRRGADPTEVERAEREALGPVRRGPAEASEEDLAPLGAVDHEHDYAASEPADLDADAAGEPDRHDPFASEPKAAAPVDDPFLDEPAPVQEHLVPEALAPEPQDPGPATAEAPLAPPPAPAEPIAPVRAPDEDAPVPSVSRESLSEGGSDETVEYDVEGALEAEPAESDDVLEETPEFLQETPDHDRLWFEQKPPRDFDFDG
jgi:hypothetical protein